MTRRDLWIALVLCLTWGPGLPAQSIRADAEAHYRVALRALDEDHERVAIEALRTALELDPAHAMAHYSLARVLRTASPEDAIAHLDRALQLGLPAKETTASADLRIELLYAAARRRTREVFTDPDTGLMWTVRDNGDDVDWATATKYCAALTLRGFSDWRLPTLDELAAMSDRSQIHLYKIRRPLALSACCPWSSTRISGTPTVFAFNFGEPWPYKGPPLNCRALCVRR